MTITKARRALKRGNLLILDIHGDFASFNKLMFVFKTGHRLRDVLRKHKCTIEPTLASRAQAVERESRKAYKESNHATEQPLLSHGHESK